jgi:hypothetical protein
MATDTIRHRGRRGAILGAVLLAVALVGCSDDGTPIVADDDPPATSTTDSATVTTEAAGSSSAETEPATGPDADEEEATAAGALLTEDDLPEGWVAAGTAGEEPFDILGEADEPPDEDEDCPEPAFPPDVVRVGQVRFEDGSTHVLVQGVLAAPDTARAEEMFATLRASNGCTPAGPVEAVTVPGVGDEAYIATNPIGVMAGVRRGRHAAFVLTFSFEGSDDTDLVTGVLELAADRLPG